MKFNQWLARLNRLLKKRNRKYKATGPERLYREAWKQGVKADDLAAELLGETKPNPPAKKEYEVPESRFAAKDPA